MRARTGKPVVPVLQRKCLCDGTMCLTCDRLTGALEQVADWVATHSAGGSPLHRVQATADTEAGEAAVVMMDFGDVVPGGRCVVTRRISNPCSDPMTYTIHLHEGQGVGWDDVPSLEPPGAWEVSPRTATIAPRSTFDVTLTYTASSDASSLRPPRPDSVTATADATPAGGTEEAKGGEDGDVEQTPASPAAARTRKTVRFTIGTAGSEVVLSRGGSRSRGMRVATALLVLANVSTGGEDAVVSLRAREARPALRVFSPDSAADLQPGLSFGPCQVESAAWTWMRVSNAGTGKPAPCATNAQLPRQVA